MLAKDLYQEAKKMELRLGELYEDIARHFPDDSDANDFFLHMSAQEHIHGNWVDEMLQGVDPAYEFTSVNPEDFAVLEATISDIHDEVTEEKIGLNDALEMLIHLETSTAEDLYLHFPQNVPGLPVKVLERMIRSCVQHAKQVTDFRDSRKKP